jgi:erythronate-4-phosphate dehydrogenase
MKIVADKNMPALTETFARHGEVALLDGRQICRADLVDATVLLVRSVTRVNQELLRGTGIRFVGSATIGIDHLDTHWLEANNIAWAHAPGCNADSAAQYTLAMMMLACGRTHKDLSQQRVGIIGRGNVGRRLERLLNVLEIPVMACDPPLQESGQDQLVSMQEACENSIISLHVPLTRSGNHPTENLFDRQRLNSLNTGTLLVNTSRGAVIEKSGFLEQLRSGRLHAALDVWPDEPFISKDWLEAVSVATPHVAGYSLEGKQAGTEMLYRAFCKAFSIEVFSQPSTDIEDINLNLSEATSVDNVLKLAIQSSCPVARDDAALRAASRLQAANGDVQIDSLRSGYPARREFKSHLIQTGPDAETDQLRQLGFRIT